MFRAKERKGLIFGISSLGEGEAIVRIVLVERLTV